MGHWGIKSYENDAAADALDAGFDRVHGERYEELMDDRNPLTYEQVQQRLADSRTLAASIDALWEAVGREVAPEDWDDETRLAMAGVLVRHAELKVPIPEEWRRRAIDWLDGEEIEWESATTRKLRRQKEVDLLRRATSAEPEAGDPQGVT
jgi:hypothetical protein